ncbi:TetR/AcrR family transcriptional regulator [Planococcus sp. SE5232]|uniref:TetR/AcrR family transcriptional regulator n=1 Tax=unclassified Planococcus (in: firmicutes) TaxID=2662419 RepID=UPI001CBEF02F|nr:TetR/AcrR family transcriptional regulator [Planococcus sp. 4-30]
MPKLIDSNERKQLIAEATWKIMLEHGMEAASSRNIAKEAGLSLGALRYYFSSQEELMLYAEALIFERLTDKTSEIFQQEQTPLEKIIAVLMVFLPAADELEVEAKVRLIFKLQGGHSRKGYREGQDVAMQAIKNVMSNLILLNLLKKELDVPLETNRLINLLDGMVLDALVRPEYSGREQQRKMIVYHLQGICKEPVG